MLDGFLVVDLPTAGSISATLPNTMALPVSLDLIAQELESIQDDMTAYVNRKTGDIVSVSQDELTLVEEEIDEDELPDWQLEMLPQLREIASSEDWLALPDKFDIHEWEIMRHFAETVDDEDLAERLDRAIHGKGAFRMFRATIEDTGCRDEWYAFRRESLKKIAQEALEGFGIPYK